MKTILFYWSKGADTRRKIVLFLAKCEAEKRPCYLNNLAAHLKISHVATKKHLKLLIDKEFVEILNPDGKPQFLALTKKGKEVVKELTSQ